LNGFSAAASGKVRRAAPMRRAGRLTHHNAQAPGSFAPPHKKRQPKLPFFIKRVF